MHTRKTLQGIIRKGFVGLALTLALGLGGQAAMAVEGQININTADAKELEALPFIGEGRAKAIVTYRQKNGQFETLDELSKIPDIGDGTMQAIRPYLTLSGPSTFSPKGGPPAVGSFKVVPTIVTQPGEIRLLTDQDYYPVLQSLIGHATHRIDLAMFLFKTTDSAKNRAGALVNDLIMAKKRGLEVNVLLEKSGYDPQLSRENARVGAQLKRQGVNVRFDSEKITTHSKIVVIDQRLCLLGSHNFTSSALSSNHEASLLIDNETLASELLEYMRGIE